MLTNVMQKFEFFIVGLSEENNGGYVVLLENEEILRRIPIHIGSSEGQALAMALEEFDSPRPMTHNLILNMLRDMRAQLQETVIHRLFEGVFFAKLFITLEGREEVIEVDARPSDAMTLAVLLNGPIHCTSEIVELAGIQIEKKQSTDEDEDEDEFYGMSVEDLEKELKKAITREEYENASKIRDRINFLNHKKK